MGDFRSLNVWQRAKALAIYIYGLTDNEKFSRDFGLRDQLRRAAVSIPSNIAEGEELDTNRQAAKHFYFAKGSSAEIRTQIEIAAEVGYIGGDDYQHVYSECEVISAMLQRLINSRMSSIDKKHLPDMATRN